MAGVELNRVVYGDEHDGVPLLIAHGLFGSARNWGVLAKRFSRKRQVIAVDMRNHADSPWAERHHYQDLADDLTEVIGAGQCDVLGHSMGGKAAMVLAVQHPERVRKLIVADIAPVGYSHTQAHVIAAMRQVDLATVSRRSEATAQLGGLPDDGTRSFVLQSLDVAESRWRLNLDVLDRDMSEIIGFPEVSGSFDGPSLFLSGADSDYVRPEHRAEIKRLFPKARFAKIPGAGHWLHAEKPREFEAAVDAFLGD